MEFRFFNYCVIIILQYYHQQNATNRHSRFALGLHQRTVRSLATGLERMSAGKLHRYVIILEPFDSMRFRSGTTTMRTVRVSGVLSNRAGIGTKWRTRAVWQNGTNVKNSGWRLQDGDGGQAGITKRAVPSHEGWIPLPPQKRKKKKTRNYIAWW